MYTYREVYPFGGAEVPELGLLPDGVALHLVGGRRHARDGEQVLQLRGGEVADADGSGLAGVVEALHRRPRRRYVGRDNVFWAEAGAFLQPYRPVYLTKECILRYYWVRT
jgi:hypothetical protein